MHGTNAIILRLRYENESRNAVKENKSQFVLRTVKKKKNHTGNKKSFLMLNMVVPEVTTRLRRGKILSSETVSTIRTYEMLFGFFFSKRKLIFWAFRNKISTKNVNIKQKD